MIGSDGIRAEGKKVDKVKNMKELGNITDVKSFIGLCSYYRRFIKDFAKIAKPLNELLKKDIKFKWKTKQQKVFDELKKRLINYPIVRYPDLNKEFLLMTDASRE